MITTCVSAPVVFYEDAYENAPGESVARRATQTVLTVSADGGADGALLYVTAENIGNLACVGGALPAFPHTRMLAPDEHVDLTAVCEPRQYSGAENDIRVRARIKPAGGGDVRAASASTTAVLVQVTATALVPQKYRNRHVFGVCELLQVDWYPQTLTVDNVMPIDTSGLGAWFTNTESRLHFYQLSPRPSACTLQLTAQEQTFTVSWRSIEPTGLYCAEADVICRSFGMEAGRAGGVGMELPFYLMPTNVSFTKLRVYEQPTMTGVHTGYFADPAFSSHWYHTVENGAGNVAEVGDDNDIFDGAYCDIECPEPWTQGLISWDIVGYWMPPDGIFTNTLPKHYMTDVQTFRIDAAGTVSVEKGGHRIERTIGNLFRLNGNPVTATEEDSE